MVDRVIPIGTLAKLAAVSVETIRYYEHVGLLQEPERTKGNQRRYTRHHRARLAFIRHARDLGFSVEAVRGLLELSDNPAVSCDAAHAIASVHLADVRSKIEKLSSLEKELDRIRSSCSGGVAVRDCAIIESLIDAPAGSRRE